MDKNPLVWYVMAFPLNGVSNLKFKLHKESSVSSIYNWNIIKGENGNKW